MHIVIDEWLTHYLSGAEGLDNQAFAFRFVQAVIHKCDPYATLNGEKFVKKVWQLAKDSESFPARTRQIVKVFLAQVVFNSQKFVRLRNDQARELPQDIARKAGSDDEYLLKTHLSFPGSVIVTTDGRLCDKFKADERVNIRLAPEFVQEYDG